MRAGRDGMRSLGYSALLLAGMAWSLPAQGAPSGPIHTVTAVTANVSVGNYTGPCPAKLVFTGTITTAAIPKVAITYQWIRSDNTKGPKRTLKMTSTTATVTDTWQLGRAGEMIRAWKKLQILAPTGITSNQADAVILCH
jgi:hypothetical protein